MEEKTLVASFRFGIFLLLLKRDIIIKIINIEVRNNKCNH